MKRILFLLIIILSLLIGSCHKSSESILSEIIPETHQLTAEYGENSTDNSEVENVSQGATEHNSMEVSSAVQAFLNKNYESIMPGVKSSHEEGASEVVEFSDLLTFEFEGNRESEGYLPLVNGYPTIKSFYSENFMTTWENYIMKEFNIEIKMTLRDFFDKDIVSYVKDLEGIITLTSVEELLILKENNLISPLNDLVKENKNLNYYSNTSLKTFTDFNGNLWAIPNTEKLAQHVRIYRKDTIDNTTGKVPVDINEFFEYCNVISNTDIDKNGKNDTYAIFVDQGYRYADFIDVFRAFGIYVDAGSTLQFSPVSNRFESAYFHENISNALDYINSLQQNNCIKMINEISVGDFYTTNYLFSAGANYDDYYGGFYLQGDNREYLIEEIPGANFYALLSSTSNKKEVFDNFINKFLFTLEGNLALSYGLPEINYKLINNEALNTKIIITNFHAIDDTPNENSALPINFFCSIFTADLNKNNNKVSELDYKERLTYHDYYNSQKNNFINLSFTKSLEENYKTDSRIEELDSHTIHNFLAEKISAIDTIDSYRSAFIKYGGVEILEDLNKKIKQ